MRTGSVIWIAGLLGLLAAPTFAVVIEDWADMTDDWGGTINKGTYPTRIEIPGPGMKVAAISATCNSSQWGDYAHPVSSTAVWDVHDLSGLGITQFRFTYTNLSAGDQDWEPTGSGTTDPTRIRFSFPRYSKTNLNSNSVAFLFKDLLFKSTGSYVIPAGQTVTIVGNLDEWDSSERTEMFGWDTANDRVIVGGYFWRADYSTPYPYSIGPIEFVVPEPATMGLLVLGFAGLAARRRRR